MDSTFYAPNDYRNYLAHHGIKGMRWGVRRFQNADGSYTSAGKKRYGVGSKEAISAYRSSYDKASSMGDKADEKWRETQAARKEIGRTAIGRTIASARNKTEAAKKYNKLYDEWSNMQDAADEQWRDSDAKYKMTGRNRLERVANNIKYDMKPLTPEEKAVRNAKIKKAVIVAGTVAATAAVAYAGHKYLKNIDAEADKIMRGQKAFSEKAWMSDLVRYNAKLNTETYSHRTMYRPGDNSEAAIKSRKRIDDARAERDLTQRIMTEVMGSYNRNIADKQVRKAARRELIQRDITMAPYNAVEKLRKARGSKLDPVSVQFATDDRALRAKQRVEDLAKRGRTSESFTKRDSYYSPQRLKKDLSFIGREAAQTAKYKADQLKKKKH